MDSCSGCFHSWAAPCTTIHFLQYWKGINQMSESLRKIWSLNTCASGRWSSGEQADVGHSTLHTPQCGPHSTLHRGKEGHSIATCGHKLSGSQRYFSHYPKKLTWNTLKTTSNQYSFGNIDNPEKARQSQHIQAQDLRKHRVRYTHVFNQHITTIREGSGYQNGWTVPKWLPTITLKSWHCQHCFKMCRQDLCKHRIRNTHKLNQRTIVAINDYAAALKSSYTNIAVKCTGQTTGELH